MNYTEKAIEKAIKGGYPKDNAYMAIIPHNEQDRDVAAILESMTRSEWLHPRVFLDPLFWQSLGKSLGWGSNKECNRCGIHINGWKAHWHRFIDFLVEGKTPDQFFEKLLANEK